MQCPLIKVNGHAEDVVDGMVGAERSKLIYGGAFGKMISLCRLRLGRMHMLEC